MKRKPGNVAVAPRPLYSVAVGAWVHVNYVHNTMMYRGKPHRVMTGEEIRRYNIQMVWELDPDAPTYH
jgi:hypothetical protein